MKRIPYIYLIVLTSLLVSCTSELPSQGRGEGTFLLSLLTAEVTTEEISRAATFDFDVDTFKVTVADAKGLELIKRKAYGQITEVDRTLPVAQDYRIDVESCSPSEALETNNNWGKERFFGTATFAIAHNETTSLSIECTMANAGLVIIFDNSFVSKFPTYAATTQDVRSLVFKNTTTPGVAYYNTDQSTISVPVRFTGSSGGWNDRIDITKDVLLSKGKITRLRVKYNDGTSTDGDANISFETDTSMTETNDDVMVE